MQGCESTYRLASSVVALDMAVTIGSLVAGGGDDATEETPLASGPIADASAVSGFDPDLYRQPELKDR